MITLIYSKRVSVRNNLLHSLHMILNILLMFGNQNRIYRYKQEKLLPTNLKPIFNFIFFQVKPHKGSQLYRAANLCKTLNSTRILYANRPEKKMRGGGFEWMAFSNCCHFGPKNRMQGGRLHGRFNLQCYSHGKKNIKRLYNN